MFPLFAATHRKTNSEANQAVIAGVVPAVDQDDII
jgi:hypothetical protein